MKKIITIVLLLFLSLSHVYALVSTDTILATYTPASPIYFTEHPWTSGTKVAAKISSITIQFLGKFNNSAVQVLMEQQGTPSNIKIYDKNGAEVSGGQLYFLSYHNDFPGAQVSGVLQSGKVTNMLPANVSLMNKTIVVEFYVVPDNQLIKDEYYTIKGLPDMDLSFGATKKNSNKIDPKKEQITINSPEGSGGSVSLIQPGQTDTDGNLDDVIYGEPEERGNPKLYLDTVDSPNLESTVGSSTYVKVADLYGYWEKAVAERDITINIKPDAYALLNADNNAISIPYLLYFGSTLVVDDGSGHDFQTSLSVFNNEANKKLMGAISASINLNQAEINTKPSGTYTDTIRISISSDI